MVIQRLSIVLWVVVYLTAIEIGLEVRATLRGYDTILFGSYKKPSPEKDTPFSSQLVLPLRADSESERSKRQVNAVRYWIASSSHAEDSYLDRGQVFPTILETLLLRDSGIQAVVINASHAGMDIEDNRIDLQVRGPRLHPDFVVLYQMSLTINGLSKRLLSTVDPRLSRIKNAGGSEREKERSNWADRFVEQTAIYAQLKGYLTAHLATQRVLSNTLGSSGEAEFQKMLYEFIKTSRSIGAEPVLCTFATSHVRRDLPEFPENTVTFIFKYNPYLSLEGWVHTVERFNAIVRRIAAEEHLALVDIEAELAGHHEYFRDYVHFTPSGHAAVAEVMRRTLAAKATAAPPAPLRDVERSPAKRMNRDRLVANRPGSS